MQANKALRQAPLLPWEEFNGTIRQESMVENVVVVDGG